MEREEIFFAYSGPMSFTFFVYIIKLEDMKIIFLEVTKIIVSLKIRYAQYPILSKCTFVYFCQISYMAVNALKVHILSELNMFSPD